MSGFFLYIAERFISVEALPPAVASARHEHDAEQARRRKHVSRDSKVRDFRRARASHGRGCDCTACDSKPSREARKCPVGAAYTPNTLVSVDARECAHAYGVTDGVVTVRHS